MNDYSPRAHFLQMEETVQEQDLYNALGLNDEDMDALVESLLPIAQPKTKTNPSEIEALYRAVEKAVAQIMARYRAEIWSIENE